MTDDAVEERSMGGVPPARSSSSRWAASLAILAQALLLPAALLITWVTVYLTHRSGSQSRFRRPNAARGVSRRAWTAAGSSISRLPVQNKVRRACSGGLMLTCCYRHLVLLPRPAVYNCSHHADALLHRWQRDHDRRGAGQLGMLAFRQTPKEALVI
ncbi:hypothetical protein [Sphingopyxis sp.]|uniref:hypothetical protein n=1 Tax=Sphingopyxis sp. TaxID=1908224 RepID=UPI0025EF0B42|nr:hypothetical protein [Sphingopyxis sp.]